MTNLRYFAPILLVAVFAATAFGQYGLYGAPDLVQLPSPDLAPPVSNVSYAAPAFQPLVPHPQQPWPGGQPSQPAYPITRQPLLQPTPAVRHAIPPYAEPQYVAHRNAPRPQAAPHYAAPGMVQPHPALTHYYTPAAPSPAQPAIPDAPSPPGMVHPSPSDQHVPAFHPGDQHVPALHPNGCAVGCAPSHGGYLDYDPGWGYGGAMPRADAGCGTSFGGQSGCGPFGAAFSAGCHTSRWYGGASALLLGRSSANRLWTSYQHGYEPNQLLHTDMIGLKWRAGGEVKLGRRFGCHGDSPWALQASYFTIEPFSGYRSVTHASGVSTVLTVGHVFFHGEHATDWFDHAQRHELWRRNEIHNVEVSFVRRDLAGMYGSRFDCDFDFGVRYFRFWEHLTFGTRAGAGRVDPGWAQRAYLEDKVGNDLLGFQFGANLGYHIHPSCRIYAAPKFGIYNNHIDHYFMASLSDGTVGTVVSPPGQSFPAQSSTNALSFLTQLDVGLDWQVTQRLSAQAGYRVMVATGIALADHQIPHFINDIPEMRHINHNGELILHGAFAGVTFNY